MWPVSVCPASWPAAVAYPQCAEQTDYQQVRVDCGGYHTITWFGLDFHVSCSYEVTGGVLVAATYDSITGVKCWGPPGGIAPTCSNPISTTVCATDGGVSADGGSCLSAGSLPYLQWNDPCPGDGGAACYANCSVFANSQYVGCVSASATGTRCYASCAECP